MSRARRSRDNAPSSSSAAEVLAPLAFSSHAARRAARRNIGRDGVAYVLAYGRVSHRTGARFFFLGRRDLPFEDCRNPWVARLVGTVVVVASDGEIITTYRNRHASRCIARKVKYRLFDVPFRPEVPHSGEPPLLDAIA